MGIADKLLPSSPDSRATDERLTREDIRPCPDG
jgi:hypothetical protein